jgi:hypothetical protein
MAGAKWLFLIYFGYRAVGYHSPEIFKMSGSGATYYDEELKYLYRLLKNLPSVILKAMPTTSQITSLIRKRQKTSAAPKVWSAKLKSSFGWRDHHCFIQTARLSVEGSCHHTIGLT